MLGFRPIAPLLLAVSSLLLLAGMAVAQSDDPPARVGRLSDATSSVYLAADDSDSGWQPIGINYPVTVGDNVWVGPDGRAEIDFGAGQLRLANEANVHFSDLDESRFSAYLANGRASLRIRAIEPGETAKLDTPNAQIDILRPGTYRLDTSADTNHTTLVVRDGEAEIRIGDRTSLVRSGQTASVQGNGFGSALMVRDGYGTDSFDSYALERNRRIESGGISEQYVSSYVPGVADLTRYGTWDTVPTYGAVWYPTLVTADWVPYRDGSWTYVRPWGWTWVDDAPWGWAPFHYGRWVRIGARWGWCPGEYVARPVYSPALVAWFGGASGTGWSSRFRDPTFGWVPLSWGEPYWPHYRHSTDYWRRANQPVAVDVRRMSTRQPQRFNYANARVAGAVTAAPGEVLSNRRPVGPNHYTVDARQLANVAPTTAPISVRPALRPLTIDKMPSRPPLPASAFTARGRQDFRSPDAPTPAIQSTQRPALVQPSPMPAPGVVRESAPAALPQPAARPSLPAAPVQSFPAAPVYVPQQRPPQPIQRGAPVQLPAAPTYVPPAPAFVAPAPRSIAPAPQSIAPPPQLVAPAPQSITPAPQSVAPPPGAQRQVPQQSRPELPGVPAPGGLQR